MLASLLSRTSADLWVGILLAVLFWPSGLFLFMFLLPLGALGRLMSFVLMAPLPLGQRFSGYADGEQPIIRQRFASGSFGTGLCRFRNGLHVTLTNKRLICELATTLPYVALLAIDHGEIVNVQAATDPWSGTDRAVAFSIAHAGRKATFYFVPKDRGEWLRACEQAHIVRLS